MKYLIFFLFSFNLHARYHTIIQVCGTTQGNGYNWSSTISWLATSLLDAKERALEIEKKNPGAQVGIVANCFAGASSGSGVTGLYDAVLTNSNLSREEFSRLTNDPLPGDRIMTADEVDKIAKTLRFVAIGSDFTRIHQVWTVVRTVGRNVVNRIPFIGRGYRGMWKEQLTAQVALADFATYTLFGQYVPWNIVDSEIKAGEGFLKDFGPENFETEEVKRIVANYSKVHQLFEMPNIDQMSEALERDLEKLEEMFWAVSRHTRSELHKVNQAIYFEQGHRGYLHRRDRGAKPVTNSRAVQNPLQRVMNLKPTRGFMTLTMGLPFDDMDKLNQAVKNRGFPYDDMRAFVFMTRETADELLASEEYQKVMKEADVDLSKFIIAVVDEEFGNRFTMVNSSIREPILLDELAGELSGDSIRVQAIYDPSKDPQKTFRLVELVGNQSNRSVFVLGGFPYEDISTWMSSFFQIDAWKKLFSQADRVVPLHHLFGSYIGVGEERKNSFASKRVLSPLLNNGQEGSAEHLVKWERWVNLLDEKLRPLMAGYGIPFTRTKYKWGPKSNIPAMISGRSAVLVANSHNNATQAMNRLRAEQGLDPLPVREAYQPEFRNKPPGLISRCSTAIKNLFNR